MTKQQEKYVGLLVEGLTQRQAYLKAFPHSKKWKEKSVDENASKLFALTKVQTRFLELQKIVHDSIQTETIASKQEVLEFFTRLMRREEKEQVVSSLSRKEVWTDDNGERREVSTRDPVIVDIDTKNSDAFKGAEALAKHYGVLNEADRGDNEDYVVVEVVNDIE
nr:terminase small subunit [Erysipelothrix sp. HDW6C]